MSDSEESVQGFNLKQDNPKEWRRQYLEKYYESVPIKLSLKII